MIPRRYLPTMLLAGVLVWQTSAGPSFCAEYQQTLTIAAANSLKDALRTILPLFEKEQGNVEVRLVWGPSQTLREQIEQGAPVDVFMPSSLSEIDALEQKSLTVAGTKHVYAATRLVVITQAAVPAGVTSFLDLPSSGVRRIAIGDPKTSSVGKFAIQALRSTHLDQTLKSRYVYGEHSGAVLGLVAAGEADVGLVYRTDAVTHPKIRIVADVPADAHPPIVYGLATVWTSRNTGVARRLAEFMRSPRVQGALQPFGFEAPSARLTAVAP